MNLDSITGFATEVSGIDMSKYMIMFGAIFFIIIGWILLLSLINFILFVISCFKHDIPFNNLISKATNSFTKNYKSIFKYYIPICVTWFLLFVYYIFSLFFPTFVNLGLAFYILIGLVYLISFIQNFYFFIVDTSLAKSYYKSILSKEFSFSWISIIQIIKLIVIGIIYLIFFVLSILLLGIPWIFLGYILPFVRYPVIVEDKGIIESIKIAFGILKDEFWNVVFYIGIYGLIFLIFNMSLGIIPILNQISNLITMILIQPFATIYFTEVYYEVENKYMRDEAKAGKGTSDKVKEYIRDMESKGYSDEDIKNAMLEQGYTQDEINIYFS
jgi:hypothetical protein